MSNFFLEGTRGAHGSIPSDPNTFFCFLIMSAWSLSGKGKFMDESKQNATTTSKHKLFSQRTFSKCEDLWVIKTSKPVKNTVFDYKFLIYDTQFLIFFFF